MTQLRTVVGILGMSVAGLVVAAGAQTPALPDIDQLLNRNIEAMGGRAALEKITSIRARGTISIPEAGLTGTIELVQKAPDKALTIVDLGGAGQREGFDGTVGWAEDPQNGLREKGGAELAEAKRSAVFGRELRLKSLYRTLTVTGRERIGTREAVVVEAVPAEGGPARLFFDVESGLLVRQIVTRTLLDGTVEVDLAFDDFRAVDGVKRPFAIRQTTQMFTATVVLSDVTHNAAIEDAIFRKPGL